MVVLISTMIAGLTALCFLWWRVNRYNGLARRAGHEYGVDPALVLEVIRRESGFNPRAVGKAGEIGLMQVTAAAAGEWARATGADDFVTDDLFRPEINIHAGAWYLARAIQRWSDKPDPLPYALAEYNAGRSNVLRWSAGDEGDPEKFRASITYPGTRRYIKDILDNYRRGS